MQFQPMQFQPSAMSTLTNFEVLIILSNIIILGGFLSKHF